MARHRPPHRHRARRRAGLTGDALDEPLAFVDRFGAAQLSFATALKWRERSLPPNLNRFGLYLPGGKTDSAPKGGSRGNATPMISCERSAQPMPLSGPGQASRIVGSCKMR